MRTLLLVLLALPLTAIVPTANAGPCDAGALPRQTAGGYYVDSRPDGIWIYQETNGLSGLQRGSRNVLGDRDPCVDDPTVVPDRAIL